MLNCPGANTNGEAVVISNVATLAASRRTCVTRIGWGTDQAASATCPVDIQDLQTCRAQPLTHCTNKTFHQLVAEVVIGFAFFTQAPGVDPERAHELDSPRIECPTIRGYEPGR